MKTQSLQQKYSPKGICFGCGPANDKGLRINSFPEGGEGATEGKVIATWRPELYHQAFPGVLNGGIIGSLLDCHCNWTAAWHLMNRNGLDAPPCTVTAEYAIKLLRPTPVDKLITLEAWVVDSSEKRATVEGVLIVDDKVCDKCTGVFASVGPGHPAYHRW